MLSLSCFPVAFDTSVNVDFTASDGLWSCSENSTALKFCLNFFSLLHMSFTHLFLLETGNPFMKSFHLFLESKMSTIKL